MPFEKVRFEDFELDRNAFELRRAGRIVRLERIPLQILFLLADNHQRLVTREEILHAIWGSDVFVDADNSINTAIRKVRQALRDDPENPRFLRTVSGKGYRFAASISEAPSPSIAKEVEASRSLDQAPRFKRRTLALAVAVAIGLVLAIASAFVASRVHKTNEKAGRKEVLAVLPFVNLSGDPRQDYFADGMTEEMTAQLGDLDPEHLGVIARTSSMQYTGTEKGAAEIARELGADYLLEGSVRRDAHQVRVTAQLIRGSDQTHLWGSDFDRDAGDILKLESDLALAISTKIDLTVSAGKRARLAEARPVNVGAHESYLLGLHYFDLRTKTGIERAMQEFQRALELDANYAPPLEGLARAYSLAAVVGAMSSLESMPKAKDFALRAIAADPYRASGYTTLGFVNSHFEFDWSGAERQYLRAIELNPNDSYGHVFYSNSYLSPLGRHSAAIEEMQKAIEIDPLSAPVQSFLGRTYVWARQEDKGLAQFLKCAEMFPGLAINHERLAQAYAARGKFEDAIAEDAKARLISGEDEASVREKEAEMRKATAAGGSKGYWKKLLEITRMPDNPPESYSSLFGAAVIYSRLGETTEALDSLEAAYDRRELAMTELAVEPAFDALRSNRRFQILLNRLHLDK